MANGRNKLRRGDAGRDAGGFVALPWAVLDSPAYASLSFPARALLLEVARQFVRDNNGRLLASAAHLEPRGWKSRDVITRAKRELLQAGFLFETVKGHRPNKASWYAVTWRELDRHPGYDVGTIETFQRGAYRLNGAEKTEAPTPSHGTEKNAPLTPSGGHIATTIGPPDGLVANAVGPSDGPIKASFGTSPRPSGGHHLDNHLPASAAKDVQDVEGVQGAKRKAAPVRSVQHCPTGDGRRVPQPPDPTAQLELLIFGSP